MQQAKFSLTEEQVAFLSRHRAHGFQDRSSMVRTALEQLRTSLRRQELRDSAALYAELYEQDSESRVWVEDSVSGWPQ